MGASWDGKGVNFALFSANAEKVEVCLFDDAGVDEIARYAITENDNSIWHLYLPGLNRDRFTAIVFTGRICRKRGIASILTSF